MSQREQSDKSGQHDALIEALLNGNGGVGKCTCETCMARRKAAETIQRLERELAEAEEQIAIQGFRKTIRTESSTSRALIDGGLIKESRSRAISALAWAVETFGDVANDKEERAMRFLEEAVELVMSLGLQPETLQMIAARVYSRPKGDRWREFGQAQLTLELLGEVFSIDPQQRASIEFERIQTIPQEEWERRHAAKVEMGIAK